MAARPRPEPGAQVARADILFFLDADITVTPSTISTIAASFSDRPEISAMFCSYQKETIPANFFSQYKNLVHHHTHQTAHEDAATFCGGFGAIRRSVFHQIGGFEPDHRFLEDVELGYRLHQAGHKIFLNKSIQLTHHKRYSFAGLIKSDLFGRAIPWTRIMLAKRIIRNDLNTRTHNALSVAVAFALLVVPATALHQPAGLVAAVMLLLARGASLDRHFLKFVRREKGVRFTLGTIGMLWFTYVYSGVGLLLGIAGFLGDWLLSREPGKRGTTACHDSPLRYLRPAVSPGRRRRMRDFHLIRQISRQARVHCAVWRRRRPR